MVNIILVPKIFLEDSSIIIWKKKLQV